MYEHFLCVEKLNGFTIVWFRLSIFKKKTQVVCGSLRKYTNAFSNLRRLMFDYFYLVYYVSGTFFGFLRICKVVYHV